MADGCKPEFHRTYPDCHGTQQSHSSAQALCQPSVFPIYAGWQACVVGRWMYIKGKFYEGREKVKHHQGMLKCDYNCMLPTSR